MTASADTRQEQQAWPRGRRPQSWPALTEQLLEEFPDAAIGEVVRQVAHAREAVEQRQIPFSEAIDLAADLARSQLSDRADRSAEAV